MKSKIVKKPSAKTLAKIAVDAIACANKACTFCYKKNGEAKRQKKSKPKKAKLTKCIAGAKGGGAIWLEVGKEYRSYFRSHMTAPLVAESAFTVTKISREGNAFCVGNADRYTAVPKKWQGKNGQLYTWERQFEEIK